LLEKILITGLAAAEIGLALTGCKTTEPEKPRPELFGNQIILMPAQEKTAEEILLEREKGIAHIKQIITDNHVEHIEEVFFYTHEKGNEIFSALEKKYGAVDRRLEAAFDKVQDFQSLMVILPVELIGQNKDSYVCLFRKMTQEIKTQEDLTSLVVDYAGTLAEINAGGMIMNNTPIRMQEIRTEIGPLLYGAIIELKARAKQVSNGENLSQHYKQIIWRAYATALFIVNQHDPGKNPYAKEAIEWAEKEMAK